MSYQLPSWWVAFLLLRELGYLLLPQVFNCRSSYESYWAWRDGSTVLSVFPKIPAQIPVQMEEQQVKYDTLFWPPWSHTYMWHSLIHTQKHRKIKCKTLLPHSYLSLAFPYFLNIFKFLTNTLAYTNYLNISKILIGEEFHIHWTHLPPFILDTMKRAGSSSQGLSRTGL